MAKTTDAWFKFYAKDWIGDSELRLCSPAARGLLADIMSLCHQGNPYGYLKRGNGDDYTEKELCAILHYRAAEYRKLYIELVDRSRILEDEVGVYVPRLVKEHEKTEFFRAKGSLGGNPDIVGKRPDKKRKPAPGKKKTAARYEYSIAFEKFWSICPRPKSKFAALKAFNSAIHAGVMVEKIMLGMERYAKECINKESDFISHPATWLNDGCWDDVLDGETRQKRKDAARRESKLKVWRADVKQYVEVVTMYCTDLIPDLDDRFDRLKSEIKHTCGRSGVREVTRQTAAARKEAAAEMGVNQ